MKRTFKYALSAVLSLGLIVPAFAQTDNFPDTPENHWAYEALARLKKDGLLVGYPDGLFRGSRPASRYELAVAIHAVYTNLRNVTDGLQSQIDALKNANDLQGIRDQLANLQTQINALKGYGDDIANLKRLADTFQNELHALGVDVDQLKKDLGDLARRVTALEARKPAVDISGDASLWMGAGNSRDNRPGLTVDGRLTGILPNTGGPLGASTAGLDKDVSLVHELGLTFAGTNTSGPQWKGTLVASTLFSPFGKMGTTEPRLGNPYTDNGPEEVYLHDFEVKFDSSVAGLAFKTQVGRVGYKVSPYIFQRLDTTSYFSNDRWDDGKFYLDGGIVGFNILGAKLELVGGRTSNTQDPSGIQLNPLTSEGFGGPLAGNRGVTLPIDRTLGVTAQLPLTSAGNIKVAYLWLDSDPVGGTGGFPVINGMGVNRLEVYGGTVDFALGVIKLQGDYSKSNLKYNNNTVNSDKDDAWQAKASYAASKWGIYGFYREIAAKFMAPGDWGRIGILRDPTNIKGWNVGGNLNFAPGVVLNASYEHDEGKDGGFENSSAFGTATKLDKVDVSLGYRFTSNLDFKVGYESDIFKNLPLGIGDGTDSKYGWTTVGFGYGLSDAAKLTLQYQLSNVANEFAISPAGGPNHFRGGFLTSQLTIKF